MKKRVMTFVAACLALSVCAQKNGHTGYPITPVPFTAVKVNDAFWGQRLKASREVTIPLAFSKCEETGRYKNFEMAANPGPHNKVTGFSFDDTDVYKTIEGASYLLQTYPDEKLKKYIDSVLVIVARAQEPDGYLYTSRTMNPEHPHEWAGSKRWEKVEDLSHEFYNLGHMVEGAVAHYQATGQKNFLNIAIRYADCVCREIGDKPGQQVKVPGHQIAEMALAKLYVVTGDKKYLDEAKFFLDKRGYTERKDEYSQAHKPILEQNEAVGHAVRAAYMYSGIADVAALTGDQEYIDAIDRIWENVVTKKLYITGGIGATGSGEAFGKNYELPNMSAYCETCAAIGNVYWNYRLFLLKGDAKYYDVLERTLYNGVLSGISLDGGAFFYPNPLESIGQHQRSPWFGCACCPSNACRFIPSVPGYIYAVKDKEVYVNLFVANESTLEVAGKKVGLKQSTSYPWNGDIRVAVTPRGISDFAMKIRIPGWVQGKVVPSDLYRYADGKKLGYTVKVNGKPAESTLEKGYFTIQRKWKKGDVITFHLPMKVSVEQIPDKKDYYAFLYGPIVLAASTGTEHLDGLYADDSRGGHIAHGKQIPLQEIPILIGNPDSICKSLQKEQNSRITFSYNGEVYPAQGKALKLVPFFRLHNSRYAVYFRQASEEQFKAIQEEMATAERKATELANQTIDLIFPGEQQPESDHGIQYEQAETGTNKDRHFRRAKGWFGYQLKVKEEASRILITIRKDDRNKVAILLNNEKLAVNPMISEADKGGFITLSYVLPQKLNTGSCPIRFIPDGTEWTPAIYEVRLLK